VKVQVGNFSQDRNLKHRSTCKYITTDHCHDGLCAGERDVYRTRMYTEDGCAGEGCAGEGCVQDRGVHGRKRWAQERGIWERWKDGNRVERYERRAEGRYEGRYEGRKERKDGRPGRRKDKRT
jgi:hypothetical protein